MLRRAHLERTRREASAGKQMAAPLNPAPDWPQALVRWFRLKALGERQITIDCDVIQADGGTRTASITGAWIALYDGRLSWMKTRQMVEMTVLRVPISAARSDSRVWCSRCGRARSRLCRGNFASR